MVEESTLKKLKLNLRKFKEELPELVHWSSSYGGQWDSDWITIFHPDGSTETRRFVLSWSKEHVPVTEKDKNIGYIGMKPWYYTCKHSAWCYSSEISELLSEQ